MAENSTSASPNQPDKNITAPENNNIAGGSPAPKTEPEVAAKAETIDKETLEAARKILKKQQEKAKSKKIFVGCFGLGILLLAFFFIASIIFLSQARPDDPILQILGISHQDLNATLSYLTHIGFGILAFIAFIISVIGLFKSLMAKKEDHQSKRSGVMMLVLGFIFFIVVVFLWISAWLYLNKITPAIDQIPLKDYITTEPKNLTGLSAPVLVKFDATKIPINNTKYEVLSYRWDFGDETPFQFGEKISHTFAHKGAVDGRFQVILTISYLDRRSNQEKQEDITLNVFVQNEKVTAVFKANPESGDSPLSVSFDASKSVDPDGEIVNYEWDFNDDSDFSDAKGKKVDYIFDEVGQFLVRLRVTDNAGDYALAEKTINVTSPKRPIAVIDNDNLQNKYYIDEIYTFSADKSESPFGNIVKYEWNFGDKKTETTKTVKHTFGKQGTYNIQLTVTDETGQEGSDELQIVVVPEADAPEVTISTNPPLADKETVLIGSAPFTVTFDGAKSKVTGANITDYKWDFNGDEKVDDTGAKVSYTFAKVGDYTVTLFVTDSNKMESKAEVSVKVEKQSLRAVITADPIEGEIPLTVSFDASGSSYPEGKIVSYEWNFGDSESTPIIGNANLKYKYKKTGTFIAKVTVKASDGKMATAEMNINVKPVGLKACFTPNVKEGQAPLTVTFDPSCSKGTIVKYLWDFQGATGREKKPTFTFQNPGTYEVTLEVNDNENLIDEFTETIVVKGALKE